MLSHFVLCSLYSSHSSMKVSTAGVSKEKSTTKQHIGGLRNVLA